MTKYLLAPPASTADQIAQAAKLRDKAQDRRDNAEASFQRSDTDGCLSQWASSIGAQQDEANAQILERGGVVGVRVLCDASGEIVSDTIRHFPHPVAHWTTVEKWDLGRGADRRWIPTGKNSRVQKSMGLREEIRYVPGFAKITAPAGARGLGGAASAYVGRFRSDTGAQV